MQKGSAIQWKRRGRIGPMLSSARVSHMRVPANECNASGRSCKSRTWGRVLCSLWAAWYINWSSRSLSDYPHSLSSETAGARGGRSSLDSPQSTSALLPPKQTGVSAHTTPPRRSDKIRHSIIPRARHYISSTPLPRRAVALPPEADMNYESVQLRAGRGARAFG